MVYYRAGAGAGILTTLSWGRVKMERLHNIGNRYIMTSLLARGEEEPVGQLPERRDFSIPLAASMASRISLILVSVAEMTDSKIIN